MVEQRTLGPNNRRTTVTTFATDGALSSVCEALARLDEERGDLAAVCGALARAIELDDDVWDDVRNTDALETLHNALKALARD